MNFRRRNLLLSSILIVVQKYLSRLLFLFFIFLLSSCSPESTQETFEESTQETFEEEQIYKYRDRLLKLTNSEDVLKTNVNFEHLKDDFLIYVSISNKNIKLKELDSIKVGFSIENVEHEDFFTNIKEFDNTKKFFEIKLVDGNIENFYELRISKDTDFLTETEKQLLKDKDKTLVLRLDFYVDDSNPIKIYNYILNQE